MKVLLGIILADIALYLLGFLVWGLGPYAKLIWKKPVDEACAASGLREQFPERGTYLVPSPVGDQKEVNERYLAGPVAFVHVLDAQGRPAFDPRIMLNGFLLNTVFVIGLAVLLSWLPFADAKRVGVAAVAGVLSSVLIDLGDVAWWKMDLKWQLYRAVYHVMAWIIPAVVLVCFISPG